MRMTDFLRACFELIRAETVTQGSKLTIKTPERRHWRHSGVIHCSL